MGTKRGQGSENASDDQSAGSRAHPISQKRLRTVCQPAALHGDQGFTVDIKHSGLKL